MKEKGQCACTTGVGRWVPSLAQGTVGADCSEPGGPWRAQSGHWSSFSRL